VNLIVISENTERFSVIFAIDSDIRVNNIRPFRYLGIRGVASAGKGGQPSSIMRY
jgi:hypothetical protein